MQSKIFHNTKYLEENLIVKKTTQATYLHPKINVDVNRLLNRVKINEQSEKKKKVIIFFFRNTTFKSNGSLCNSYKVGNFFKYLIALN